MNKNLLKTSRIEELGKVWTPEANWRVPTADEETVFVFPAFGPDVYNRVVKQVLANKQRLPTGEKNAFMLYEAYNSNIQEIKNSRRTEFVRKNIIHNGWLWVPNINVWTPRNIKNPGMYCIFDEEGEGLAKERSVVELEDRLSGGSTERGVRFSRDRRVAFALLNTITPKYHNKGALSQDGAFIANYEVEGAEKLDGVAKVFNFLPYSFIIDNNSNEPIKTLSKLSRGSRDYKLIASFISGGDYRRGYVLPVSGFQS